MSEPNQRETQAPAAPGAVALRRGRVAETVSQGPRKLSAPYPVGLLGQLADLPDDQVLPSALEAVNRLHGGARLCCFPGGGRARPLARG